MDAPLCRAASWKTDFCKNVAVDDEADFLTRIMSPLGFPRPTLRSSHDSAPGTCVSRRSTARVHCVADTKRDGGEVRVRDGKAGDEPVPFAHADRA